MEFNLAGYEILNSMLEASFLIKIKAWYSTGRDMLVFANTPCSCAAATAALCLLPKDLADQTTNNTF